MDIHEQRKEDAKKGYGNLGNEQSGFQKLVNDKARGEVLREFSGEMEGHDAKRLPAGKTPLNHLYVPPKEEIQEEEATPLDFDERLKKFLRD